MKIIKLLPRFGAVFENAVGLAAYKNRYYIDVANKEFYNLIGGYIDGEDFIPVRFGVKKPIKKDGTIHFAIAMNAIKKDKVTSNRLPQSNVVGMQKPHLSTGISLSELLNIVNDKKILEFATSTFKRETA